MNKELQLVQQKKTTKNKTKQKKTFNLFEIVAAKGGLYKSFLVSSYLLTYFASLKSFMWSLALLSNFVSEFCNCIWFLVMHSFMTSMSSVLYEFYHNDNSSNNHSHSSDSHAIISIGDKQKQINVVEISKKINQVITYSIRILAIYAVMTASRILFDLLESKLRPILVGHIRRSLLKNVRNREYSFFVENPTAITMDRFDEVIDRIRNIVGFFYTTFIKFIASVCVAFIGLYTVLFHENPKMFFGVVFVFLFLFAAFSYFVFTTDYVAKLSKLSTKESALSANLTSKAWDSIYNIFNVKVNGAEENEDKYFDKFQTQTTNAASKYIWKLHCFRLSCVTFGHIIQGLLIGMLTYVWTSVRSILNQDGTTIIHQYSPTYWKAFSVLAKYSTIITNALLLFHLLEELLSNFFEFIEEASFIVEDVERMSDCSQYLLKPFKSFSELRKQLDFGVGISKNACCECSSSIHEGPVSVQYKNLTFNYGGHDKSIFNNLNLYIFPGEKVGVVGTSGAGKSTLLSITLGLYGNYDGEILLQDTSLKKIPECCLRRQISVIPQTTFLFNRTVYENIIFGKQDAKPEEVYECARLANAHDFILSLEGGYNFLAGNSGERLSGGQRQRIMIARAFLKKGSLLLVDEATSALDSLTESLVNASMSDLFKNRTVITVAHRVSTLKNMDRIIVLDKGRIVEEGSMPDLIEQRGYFYRYWSSMTAENS